MARQFNKSAKHRNFLRSSLTALQWDALSKMLNEACPKTIPEKTQFLKQLEHEYKAIKLDTAIS